MANRKATLTKLVKTPKGWRFCPVALHKNGNIKAVLVHGQEQPPNHSSGQYNIRTYIGSKMQYRAVGNDPVEAVRQWRLTQLASDNPDLEIQSNVRAGEKTLAQFGKDFLDMKALEPHRSRDAGDLYRGIVEEFVPLVRRRYANEIKDADVLRYHRALRERGLTDRTASNRISGLLTFLRFCGIDTKTLLPRETKRKVCAYVKKEVETYTDEEIAALLAVCKPYHCVVFSFLYQTGFRMQEAMYLEWSDIDFLGMTVRVKSKPELGFQPKDAEERSVPLVPALATLLRRWKQERSGTRYVLGSRSDLPNAKWLYALKRIARRNNLNCGNCGGCVSADKYCERWYLHKFRATYATKLLQSGVDVRTVSRLLGHSELSTTMKYLQPAKGQELQDKVNAAFALQATAGAASR
jgi:integrase